MYLDAVYANSKQESKRQDEIRQVLERVGRPALRLNCGGGSFGVLEGHLRSGIVLSCPACIIASKTTKTKVHLLHPPVQSYSFFFLLA